MTNATALSALQVSNVQRSILSALSSAEKDYLARYPNKEACEDIATVRSYFAENRGWNSAAWAELARIVTVADLSVSRMVREVESCKTVQRFFRLLVALTQRDLEGIAPSFPCGFWAVSYLWNKRPEGTDTLRIDFDVIESAMLGRSFREGTVDRAHGLSFDTARKLWGGIKARSTAVRQTSFQFGESGFYRILTGATKAGKGAIEVNAQTMQHPFNQYLRDYFASIDSRLAALYADK